MHQEFSGVWIMAYTTIDDSGLFFNLINYTGDASADQAQTGVGFQPDIVWAKARNAANWHGLADSVRGTEKFIYPNVSNAEESSTEYLESFDSDGFTHGENGSIGDSSNFTAWCWKEGTVPGLDIVSYTGNATARTIAHNLSAVPKMMIFKNRARGDNWDTYHVGVGNTKAWFLNSTSTPDDQTVYFNDTDPTSSVFTIGNNTSLNANTEACIAYVFADVQGFSKFGTYEGNGNADGTFVYTGFKPAWLLAKSIDSTAGAYIIPSLKTWVNGDTYFQYVYTNTTESNAAFVDFHSNGFKLRKNDDINNAETYIYAAFAESPFVNSNGVPTTAR